MNVDPNQFTPWETGTRTPIYKNLLVIADYFGVTIEDLCRSPSNEVIAATSKEAVAVPRAAKTERRGRKPNHKQALGHGREENKAQPTKIMSLTIPQEAANTKAVKLTYKGDITLIAIEFLDKP